MFLKSCEELHPGVNVKNIIILMIERLATHTQKNQEAESLQLFDIFSDQVASILQVRKLKIITLFFPFFIPVTKAFFSPFFFLKIIIMQIILYKLGLSIL